MSCTNGIGVNNCFGLDNYRPVSGSHFYPADSNFSGDFFNGTPGTYGLQLKGLACESADTYFVVKVTFYDDEWNSVGPFYSSQVPTTLNPAVGPLIGFYPQTLNFYAAMGVNPPSQDFGFWTQCGEAADWDASASETWLNVSLSSGTIFEEGSSNIEVTADVSELDPGNYNAEITVTSASAVNSPRTIPVTLNID